MVAGVNPRHTLCRHAPEWWPGIARNAGPACSGISGRHGPESAIDRLSGFSLGNWHPFGRHICIERGALNAYVEGLGRLVVTLHSGAHE